MAIKHSSWGKPAVPPRKFKKDTDSYSKMPEGQAAVDALKSYKRLMAASMTHAERVEFDNVIDELGYYASHGVIPNGNIKNFIATKSPVTQYWLNEMAQFIREPRQLPFMAKRSEGENALRIGVNPAIAQTVVGAMDGVDVMDSAKHRMSNGDTYKPATTTTKSSNLRDDLSESVDLYQPRVDAQNYVDADLSDAGQGHTLRSALETLVEFHEDERGEFYGPDR